MTPVEIIDSSARLISAGAACLGPFVALIAALFGTFLGAYLQRKASAEGQRTIRAQRHIEQKAEPISEYLHHASVVLGLQRELRPTGSGKVPAPIRHVYERSLASMASLQGPANVHVVMLDDLELGQKVYDTGRLLMDLMKALENRRPDKELAQLFADCGLAIAGAKLRLDQVMQEAQDREKR